MTKNVKLLNTLCIYGLFRSLFSKIFNFFLIEFQKENADFFDFFKKKMFILSKSQFVKLFYKIIFCFLPVFFKKCIFLRKNVVFFKKSSIYSTKAIFFNLANFKMFLVFLILKKINTSAKMSSNINVICI